MAIIFFYITKHFKNVLCYIFLISVFTNIKAQTNFVLNSSFEQYTICPDNTTISGVHNSIPDHWYKPDVRNAVYFNVCQNLPPHLGIPYNGFGGKFSYQYPRTGNAYVGLSYLNNGYHNYIQTQLTDSCKKGKKYYAEYYVNLSNACKYGCNNIGMLFTKNVIYADTVNQNILLANPQILIYGNSIVIDTLGWVKISDIFTAQGGEQYLTLGNFKSQANTQTKSINPSGSDGSGYYVDDVAVYNLDSFCLKADAGRDTTVKINDSVYIGSYTNGIDSIKWYNANGQVIDSTRPGFWVKPTAIGSYMYVVEQTVNGCYSRDTVWVNAVLPLKFLSYTCVLSLRGTKQSAENIFTTANEINVSHYNIQRSANAKDFSTISTIKANNRAYNEYSFTDQLIPNIQYPTPLYYRIESIDNDGKKQYSETKTINFKSQTLNVVIFPNPAKDIVNIECIDGIKQIKVLNQLQQIVQQTNQFQTANPKQSINVKQFAKGIYIIQITTSKNEVITQKLIIE